MANILVSGLINTETTVRVRQFPVNYYPIDYPLFRGEHRRVRRGDAGGRGGVCLISREENDLKCAPRLLCA